MSSRAHRERIYAAYMDFFDKAERKRRWSVFSDIPWEDLNEETAGSADLALCAETFCAVEMYLPDYVAKGLNVLRDAFGRAWFHANWGYEESKHAFALREFLLRSGHRTPEQWDVFEQEVLGQSWERPFHTARQMTLYGAIQESATLLIYKKQQALAKREGATVIEEIYSKISRDEAAHAWFYRNVVELEMQEDRDGTLIDLAHVFANFKMPGVGLVPNYDSRIEVMRDAGIDRGAFLTKVWFPMLKSIGTNRAELGRVSRQQRALVAETK
jgi:acyl-[acyl-carrier-protein] desaturase